VTPEPVLDSRRVESLVQELQRYAPHYTPELNLADQQSAGPALMRIFAHLAETVLVRLGRSPHKHFVAFLDRLGISLLPARPARAAITFRLSSSLDVAVRVPSGTRVTATGPDDDIPFETTGDLIAIPGVLAAAYGADPLTDAIYPPPPGFLTQQIRTPTELVYTVQAFAAAGTNRMQFDHAAELVPGSFIRVCGAGKAVVKKVDDGNIVTLETPLVADVASGTTVRPIRDFEVFDGIDCQQHVLFIGHADQFTVKAAAEIALDVTLVKASGSGLTPFGVAWQFWTTVDEGSPDAREAWQELEVRSDGTSGFSGSGRVVLVKGEGLEIKEVAVGGVKNRWVRALLRDTLPANGRALPEIDTIAISVKSGPAGGIQADQGFHNVTPIDLQVEPTVGFFPFGTEPRQFDQFYIASKEAFSKRKAQVQLDFRLDLQTLAAPAAVASLTGLRAYSIGLRRRLYELNLAGGSSWQVLGSPGTDVPSGAGYLPVEDSIPAAITDSTGDLIYVFVRTEDSRAADRENQADKLWVHFHRSDGSNRTWIDLDAPPAGSASRQLKFNPGVVVLQPGSAAFARVFVVGRDDKLYSRDISTAPAALGTDWQLYDSPAGQPWKSSPFVTADGSTVLVFITGDDGVVHRLTLNGAAAWTGLAPNNQSFKAISRPFAQAFGAGDAKVFVFGQTDTGQWQLFECDTRDQTGDTFEWTNLGRPASNDDITSQPDAHSPSGFIENPGANDLDEEGKHIFLRGVDNRLYERLDEEIVAGAGPWIDRSRPGDPVLRDSPSVVVASASPVTTINVVAASGRNSLVTWAFEILRVVPGDTRNQAVLLNSALASSRDDEYLGDQLHLDDATTMTSIDKEIIAYDGARRLARLALPRLAFDPDSDTDCHIGTEDVGPADDESMTLLALHSPATDKGTSTAAYVRVAGDLVDFNFYSRLAGMVSLDPGDQPGAADEVVVYMQVFPVRTEFLSVEDTSTVPELSWEYWNGRGWLSLTVDDATRNLLGDGLVSFEVPTSIQATEVAGQENFWIRARLVGGDYGRETFKIVDATVVSEKSTLRPPKVRELHIIYTGPPVPPGRCITFNNLDYLDQTAACQIGGAHFRPFERLEKFTNGSLTLFLGFDKPFKTGPVRLLIDAAEREFDESRPPELDWRFRKDRRWKELDAEDGSLALTRQGIVTLSASDDLTQETRFGQSLFWIAGALRTDRGSSGADYPMPRLRGILPNTMWALQGETLTGEILGSSDGEPNQHLTFQHPGVLDGEEIRVNEVLSAEEREQIELESGADGVVTRDDLPGTWVRWRETFALFDAGPEDRCYVLDRAAGVLQFGDGEHGRLLPAGVDNVRAFTYRTGGGTIGNVDAGKIDTLGSAVAGVESVFNPTPAGGGSDKATTDDMLTIGPRRISHRNRAVSAEDFEELAQEASRQVAKVRCLAATNLARLGVGKPDPCDRAQRHEARPETGWVSLIIVPESTDPLPCPSLELRRTVKDFLRQHAAAILGDGDRIVVRPPDYVEVSVEADIFVTSLERAAVTETRARTALETLLHPLRGGADGTGWEFGRPIWKSDVFSALEQIDEIDRVENLRFRFRGGTDAERVAIGPNQLLASGRHFLAIKKA
jgi:hypothetical protein